MPINCRYDWYQTESDINIALLRRDVPPDQCNVVCDADSRLTVTVDGECVTDVRLAHPVHGDRCTLKVTLSKIEIKIPKRVGQMRWSVLEAVEDDAAPKKPSVPSAYPTSSSHGPKNWSAIEKQAVQEDENEKLEGDAAVNQLFQTIYKDASDETKKAMVKSFTESGGTVLSTNWDDVKKVKVECKPPDSMEHKKYET